MEGMMAARLGKALWWGGNILGVGFFLWWWWWVGTTDYSRTSQQDLIVGIVLGAIPIGIGWLCRYVLSGETKIVP
jgi:hypothetical protein